MSDQPLNPGASCISCPSYLEGADQVSMLRKGIGVPVCAKFGKPMGRITSNQKERESIARHFASNCAEFGKPRPGAIDWAQFKLTVTLPDMGAAGIAQPTVDSDKVTSCAGCSNFVREDAVARDLGWSAGLCAAKGKLLLANRHTLEARNCDMRSLGRVRSEGSSLMYLPEYDDNFLGSADPVKAFKKAQANFVDPQEYPTDKPVSAADEAHGIRAWRRISDPETGNEVFLPIYRRDFFTPEEQDKIPTTGDDEHPEDYVDFGFYVYKTAVLWTELDETPAMWGKPGTGKTEFYRHMAWLMHLPFERFSITRSTELDDLAGKMHFTEGQGTHFEYGRLPKAWMKPNIIVIDEPNTGPADVWQFLRPLTDNSKQLVLDMNVGERIKRHDDAYLGMAMNPAWDMLNVGAEMIGDADANRLMHMFFELPPAALEEEIIRKRCEHDGWTIPSNKLELVMNVAEDLRKLTDNGTLPISWAIRPQIKVARALRWFDPITAYRMASADFLEPEQQQMLLDVVRSHHTEELPF